MRHRFINSLIHILMDLHNNQFIRSFDHVSGSRDLENSSLALFPSITFSFNVYCVSLIQIWRGFVRISFNFLYLECFFGSRAAVFCQLGIAKKSNNSFTCNICIHSLNCFLNSPFLSIHPFIHSFISLVVHSFIRENKNHVRKTIHSINI